MVTFETTYKKWLSLKVLAYKEGKTVKDYLNELLDKILPAEEKEPTTKEEEK